MALQEIHVLGYRARLLLLCGLFQCVPHCTLGGDIPHAEPVVYIALSETARKISISCAGTFRVGRWGTHRRPTRGYPGERWTFTIHGHQIQASDDAGLSRGLFKEKVYIYPEDPRTPLCLDGAKYRGEFILESIEGGTLRIINAVGLESYLKGVLPAELGRPGEKGFDALKAQAVAARSYTLYQMAQRREGPFDLLPSEADQVYLGMDGEDPRANEAVESTWGIVALYKGRIIRANYSSTCAGKTASASAVWPKGGDFPYLRARKDSQNGEDFCSKAPYYRWEEVWDCHELYEVVRKNLWRSQDKLKGKDPGPVEKMTILSRTPSGRVAELGVWTQSGRYIVRGDEVRWVLRRTNGAPLRSSFIGALRKKEEKGRCFMVLEGGGFGHGVGLCQTGAMEMSRQGYNYLQILRHYYKDIDIQQIYDGRRNRKSSGPPG